MKRWLLTLTLLAATAGVYLHYYPPPRYERRDGLSGDKDTRFPVTFRTFPQCKIYLWRPEDEHSFGEYVGTSNGPRPAYLPFAGGQGTQVYYVYSRKAEEIVAARPTDWYTQDHLEIPSDNLRQNDLNWNVWPPSYFPKFLLTTPSAWQTFASRALVTARSHWLSVLCGLTGTALYGWRKLQLRRRAQARAGSTEVGGYILRESLGKGGNGEVFHALDSAHHAYALKIIHASARENPELQKRFQTEVKVWKRLEHPNIVRLFDWGQQNDVLYLVMELLEGESLGARLRRQGRLSADEFAQILPPLTSAMHCLHQQGLVHRDLKPDNIFLRHFGGPVLMDFGIAIGGDMTRATQTGSAVGTPSFMAPEQIRGLFEPATDQYALGVVGFVCLTGRRPFEADDPATMAYLHATATPPRPSSFNEQLPAAVDGVILKMLSKNPSQRYSSVEEAGQALVDALTGRSFLDEGTIASSG